MKVVDPMSQSPEEQEREQVKGRKSFSPAADELMLLEKEKVIPNREGETTLTTLPSPPTTPTLLESEPDCPVSPPRADLLFFTVSQDQGSTIYCPCFFNEKKINLFFTILMGQSNRPDNVNLLISKILSPVFSVTSLMQRLTRGLFFAHTLGRLIVGVIVLYRRHTFAIPPSPVFLPLRRLLPTAQLLFLCVSVAKENDTLLTIQLLTVRVTLQLFFWLGFSFMVFYLYLLFSFISLASLSLPICHIHKGRGQRTLSTTLSTQTHTCDVKVPCQTFCSGVVA
jgi:hypothetical protein